MEGHKVLFEKALQWSCQNDFGLLKKALALFTSFTCKQFHAFFLNLEHLYFTWKPMPCKFEQIANSFIAQTFVLLQHSFKCFQNYSGSFTQKHHAHKALIMCVITMIYFSMALYLTYLLVEGAAGRFPPPDSRPLIP